PPAQAPAELDTLSLHDALPIYTPESRATRAHDEVGVVVIHEVRSIHDADCAEDLPRHQQTARIGIVDLPRAAPCFHDTAKKWLRSEEHTSELQSLAYLVCRLLL